VGTDKGGFSDVFFYNSYFINIIYLIYYFFMVVDYFSFSCLLLVLQILSLIHALAVVTVRNPIYSILFLIGVFLLTAVLFILCLSSFFLAMVLVIVYMGAVCVLFLFVVMMLNIKLLELKRQINFVPFFFVFLSIFVIFFLEEIWDFRFVISFFFLFLGTYDLCCGLFLLFEDGSFLRSAVFDFFLDNVYFVWKPDIMKTMGFVLYTFYFFQFICASLILLVAMVGAIFLTLDMSYRGKKQSTYVQLTRFRSLFFSQS
jgi:NADH-quinone oxidoreductase subunit J